MVRVYGQVQENVDFPIPRDLMTPNSQKQKTDKRLQDVSLHFVIRQPGKPHSADIRAFDQKFVENRGTPENVTDDEVAEYRKMINEASVEELKNYDIVLCTCSASSSKRIQRGTNIAQIIIDECAMCTEPEALIPLVTFGSAKTVVLIGDHKQLRPIVINKDAKKLGLEKSLFERYADKAIMLDLQYRMVCCSLHLIIVYSGDSFCYCLSHAMQCICVGQNNKKAQLTQRERATAVHVRRPSANKCKIRKNLYFSAQGHSRSLLSVSIETRV